MPAMMTITEIAGFAGAGLAGAAYVPQISHLIRARCAAGISRLAFAVWLLASVLVTARAVAIGAGVFIVLGGIQIVATALDHVLCGPVQGHALPKPSPSPAQGQDSHGDGRRRKRAWFVASGRPLACGISRTRRARWSAARVRPGPAPCSALRQRCRAGQPTGHRIPDHSPEGDEMSASAGLATAAHEELAPPGR